MGRVVSAQRIPPFSLTAAEQGSHGRDVKEGGDEEAGEGYDRAFFQSFSGKYLKRQLAQAAIFIRDKGALCVLIHQDDIDARVKAVFHYRIADGYAVFLEMGQKQAAGDVVSELCDQIDFFAKAGQGVASLAASPPTAMEMPSAGKERPVRSEPDTG